MPQTAAPMRGVSGVPLMVSWLMACPLGGGKIYNFRRTAATAAVITALSRRSVLVNKGRGSASFISGSTAEANQPTKHMYPIMDNLHFDHADYTVVAQNMAPPPY